MIILITTPLLSKEWHFISFKDKGDLTNKLSTPEEYLSQRSLKRRERQGIAIDSTDVPVLQEYVDGVVAANAELLYVSRWNNGVIAICNSSALTAVKALPYVKGTELIKKNWRDGEVSEFQKNKFKSAEPTSRLSYGKATNQVEMLNAHTLNTAGFTGEGMFIAMFDAGYRGVDTLPHFKHLFENNQLQYAWNFSRGDDAIYIRSDHGTGVLSVMAAKNGSESFGIAPDADYMLAVTEDSEGEYRLEEYLWLIAAERADSLGVDVINSSLVYYSFTMAEHKYSKDDLDGNTAVITNAADMAAQKGILVTCSSGNNRNNAWKTIAAPADADSILTVGSVDANESLSSFSSSGPTADGRIKPDVVAQGGAAYIVDHVGTIKTSGGTSLSSPIMAAFSACVWQANPQLTNMQLIETIKGFADDFNNPTDETGYGIPRYSPTNTIQSMITKHDNVAVVTTKQGIFLPRKAEKIALFSLQGKLIREIHNSATLSLRSLPQGVFILKANLDGKSIQQRVTVK